MKTVQIENGVTFIITEEAKFSLKKATTFKKSELPASAFLIVGDSNVKATWHLPFKDTTGSVNVGLLTAARTAIQSGQFRGQKLSFSVPADVKTKVNKLWDEWQKQRQSQATASIQSEISEAEKSISEDYVSDDELLSEDTVGEAITCDALFDPVNVFEGATIDADKRTAVITINTSGWSANGHYYTKRAVQELVEHIKRRPKFFNGHEIRDKLRKIDRIPTDQVAIVAKKQGQESVAGHDSYDAWYEELPNGRAAAKARIRFSHYAVGEQTLKEAREDPTSVRCSINAQVLARKNGTAEGRKGDIIEGISLLYSPDFVSYDAATAGVDFVESALDGDVGIMEMAEARGFGIYHICESTTPKQKQKSGKNNMPKDISEAFKSLQARLGEREVRRKFWDITSFHGDILREIFVDKDNAYPSVDSKKIAVNEANTQLTDALFALDLETLKSTFTDSFLADMLVQKLESMNLKITTNPKGGDPEMKKYEFDDAVEALKIPEIKQAFEASQDLNAVKVKHPVTGEDVTVRELSDSASDLDKRNKVLLKVNAEHDEYRAKERNKEHFVEAMKSVKLPEEFVTESLRQSCKAQIDDKLPETYATLTAEEQRQYRTAKQKIVAIVEAHSKEMDEIGKKVADQINANESNTGNTQSTFSKEYIASLKGNGNGKDDFDPSKKETRESIAQSFK